jgi:hypothetical protein
MQAKIKQGLKLLTGLAFSNLFTIRNKNLSATVDGLAFGR